LVRVLRERDGATRAEGLALRLNGAELADVEMALRNAAAARFDACIVLDDGEAWVARA
jgi:hypothetical protein